jgi:hypothetical protein
LAKEVPVSPSPETLDLPPCGQDPFETDPCVEDEKSKGWEQAYENLGTWRAKQSLGKDADAKKRYAPVGVTQAAQANAPVGVTVPGFGGPAQGGFGGPAQGGFGGAVPGRTAAVPGAVAANPYFPKGWTGFR